MAIDWKRIGDKAKEIVDKRGGTEALKRDAEELRRIASEPGSLSEKAKRAAEVVKKPQRERDAAAQGHGGGGQTAQGERADAAQGSGDTETTEPNAAPPRRDDATTSRGGESGV